ncbi:hypothetical protein AB5J55_01385 [Streptomyces sp. R11]|uniref:Uncharacterized protein n=1 Tax=Streptomyces sp. R11 TaxID=3238625 RepID=A0AB39MPV2_9ACTN
MNQVRTSPSVLSFPLRVVGSGLRRLPGAEQVGKVAGSALDRIGAVSPRGRRIAVYTGAGVLGVAGVVEWPIAVTGAAVAWLTQPRPPHGGQEEAVQNGRPRPAARSGPAPTEAADTHPEPHGPGNKLASSHFHQDRTAGPVHDEPAKVGDPATASGLKRVAEASAHDHEPGYSDERP